MKKRTTFFRLALSAVILVFIVSSAFAFGLREYLWKNIRNKANICLEEKITQTISKINQINATDDNAIAQIDNYLSLYTQYCINCSDYDYLNSMLASEITDNCYSIAAVIDKDNNIVASNKEKLCAFLVSDENERGLYSCDPERFNIQLFDYYNTIKDQIMNINSSYNITLNSAYFNKADFSFVPNKCSIEVLKDITADGSGLYQYETETVDVKTFDIELDDKNYELIDLSSEEKPNTFAVGFHGADNDIFNRVMSDVNINPVNNTSKSFYYKKLNGKDLLYTDASVKIYIDGELYTLYMLFIVDENAENIMQLYRKCVVIFTIIALVIALLLCWGKNVINKSRYAFEDYQKTLINNLAHDMKTPLTAISGYAENAKKSVEKGMSEQAVMFLDAISENIFYTDTVVNRTLELNHLNKIEKIKKETVRLHEIAEKSLEKYSMILDEKRIDVELTGKCEILADRHTIEMAIENLISNAVKYTDENGSISVISDKSSFTVTNTTSERVDTANLKMPFVRGDKSRNKKSSGLGLSIVQSIAELNHLNFTISSANNIFKATLKK